jgi:hypothetical protein
VYRYFWFFIYKRIINVPLNPRSFVFNKKCPCHLGRACDTTQWLKLPPIISLDAPPCPSPCRVACVSLRWLNGCRWLFDFFPFLISLLTCNVYHCLLCFLLFNYSPYYFNFLFHFFSFIQVFFLFNLIIQLQFLICTFFLFQSSFF